MYFIGSNVMDWPLEAQRAIADGHGVLVSVFPFMENCAVVVIEHGLMPLFPLSDRLPERRRIR
jgi:hypothetical protein